MMRNQFIRENIAVISIFLFFIVVVTFFSISAEAFFSKRNILNLLRQSAPVLIAACAMTFVITTKGIDLSIGSTLAIINALCAVLLQLGWDWTVVLVSLLFLGMILGGFQGYFIAYEGIPAFIVGGLFVVYSIWAGKREGRINHEAHLAGAVWGILYMLVFVPNTLDHIKTIWF